jgi:hypothetical protein
MKRTLISILCIFIVAGSFGQTESTMEVAYAQSSVNIASDEVNQSFTPPANMEVSLKSGQSAEAKVVIRYFNFPNEAIVAFEYAISIWEKSLTSNLPIHIHAYWEELPYNQLASGKPALFYSNFKGAPKPDVFYPIALVEEITGKEYNGTDEADITCSFNKNKPWYFGTDGKTPDTQYDFVTSVLHEVGHGLGISGFFTAEEGVAKFNNKSNSPSIYDFFVFNSYNQRISDKSIFPVPSSELTAQLTSNSLFFNQTTEKNITKDISVYAPTNWLKGLSIYHFDIEKSGESELMCAHANKGQAIHNPGAQTLLVLAELGWTINEAMLIENPEKSGFENDLAQNENLNVYPNPFSGTLTIDCENVNNQSSVEIKVTDLTGSTIYSETKYDTQFNPKVRVDLSGIKPGIYLASLTDSNLKTITKRIIKN